MVPRFPLPRFPPLQYGVAFSTPAFSTPANSASSFYLTIHELRQNDVMQKYCGDFDNLTCPVPRREKKTETNMYFILTQ